MPENSKINSYTRDKPKVLVAPLDWGLGHATRCIPIIEQLLVAGCEVIIAAEGAQLVLLAAEFPDLKRTTLRGYRIKWGGKRSLSLLRIFLQIPKILIQIKRENRWLQQFLKREKIDILIADNRYGLYSPGCLTVFITHQPAIITGLGKRIDKGLQKINYQFINRFCHCWIPDLEGDSGYGGKLSHPLSFPKIPVSYIGLLSRFELDQEAVFRYDMLLLLSGPEPQRTRFEKLLIRECGNYSGPVALVRGLPADRTPSSVFEGIETHNHLSAKALNQLICASRLVISRPGYSTVMDMIKLGKRTILVPTPGQTEQEYLAKYLLEKKIAYTVTEDKFRLAEAMAAAADFPYLQGGYTDPGLLGPAIEALINKTT